MNQWERRRCCSNGLTPCRRRVEDVVEVRLDEKTHCSNKEGRYIYIYIYIQYIYLSIYLVTHRISHQTRPRTKDHPRLFPGLGHLGWQGKHKARGPLERGQEGLSF